MFEIKDKIYLNGKEFQIISGSFHYFRTVPEYWLDRLEKLKNLGCNTVETYIPWNFHETNEGEFNFEGMADIEHFLDLTKKVGLYVILRPSPYICSEWEFGGLPAWLLKDRNMRLRCSYKPYLDAVDRYYSVLIPKLAPYQIDNGGNVIMFQIENEYGYYGNDKEYLKFLADTMRKYGITVPFVTSDGPWDKYAFLSGTHEGAMATGNFGSAMEWQLNTMENIIGKDKPLMCMEFWVGWFDNWGDGHHTSNLEENKKDLEEILKRGHVNFYMYEGGTNFGFMNGSNESVETADVTSYDYDAPLTEDGEITPKYEAFKEIIHRFNPTEEIPLSTKIKKKAYGKATLQRKVGLFNTLSKISEPVKSPYALSMEEIGQNYGYTLYRLTVPKNEPVRSITLCGANDRVNAYQNKKHIFTAFGAELDKKHEIENQIEGPIIDLLCENCGRKNFGKSLEKQRKGITDGVITNEHFHFGFEIFPLELSKTQLEKIDWNLGITENTPTFYEFTLNVDELCDTFVDMSEFSKGCVFVNGFNIGRYWEIGPQTKLYVPAPLLKLGENKIIVFETEGKEGSINFVI